MHNSCSAIFVIFMHMFNNRKNTGELIFLFGLLLMAIGLPLSKFLMSISQFIMAAGWFYSGDVKNKFKIFFSNKAALITASIVLLHVIGLAYTSDMKYGWEDVRKKVPLLVYAILLSSAPKLSAKKFHLVLWIFISSVVISTIISIGVLTRVINKPVNDIRDISIFISHIRLSLLICMAIIICVWFVLIYQNRILKAMCLITALWLVAFLIIIESVTGLTILFVIGIIAYLFYTLKKQGVLNKLLHIVILLLLCTPIFIFVNNQIKEYYTVMNTDIRLEKNTVNGNPYYHDLTNKQKENGQYVWLYQCEEEVMREWPKRCGTPFTGVDGKNNPMKTTIYRYLTSKNLRKDSAGVHALNGQDIILIEQGITNYKFNKMSDIRARIYQVIWEIDNYRINNNPSGNSVTQRFEYWKTAIGIIKENFWFGVGTGDPKIAFAAQYEKTNSQLSPEWRLRSHNQFLAIAVALGFVGLGWFLFTLFYPCAIALKKHNYLYFLFFIVAFLSMITEDTLETQAGVSFYIFFHFLFFYHKPDKETQELTTTQSPK